MTDSPDNPSDVLQRTAIALAIGGGILCLITADNALEFGLIFWRQFLRRPSFDFFPLEYLGSLCVPWLYLVFSRFIRRGRYGAYISTWVILLTTLIRALFATFALQSENSKLFTSPRFLIVFPVYCVAHAIMIVALTKSRRVWQEIPNAKAVVAATRRLPIALCCLSVTLLIISTAPSWNMTMHYIPTLLRVACAGLAVAILIQLRVARANHRSKRPSVWMVAIIVLPQLLDMLSSFHFGTMQAVFHIFAPWCLIELLHARRICEGPVSYGFEPIFPSPSVLPAQSVLLRSDDAPSA